jgi:hypothetical protein
MSDDRPSLDVTPFEGGMPPEARVKWYVLLPQFTPMAPTLIREPFHRDGWVYEEKVDGWRMLAYKDGDRVRW